MRRRIFIAIGLPEELREKIMEAVKRWQWLPIRWVSPQNWHITLVPPFYATDGELDAVKLLLAEEVKGIHPFSVLFDSVILAPPEKKARMIWLSGAASEKLLELKRLFEGRIASEKSIGGFKEEEREIFSHITLARFEEGGLAEIEKKTRILEKLSLAFEVSAIDVMESRLRATGAEYEVLSSIPFGESRDDPARYEFLPHTADLRMRVQGKTIEEFFQNALLGMADYLKKKSGSAPTMVRRQIAVSGLDQTALLIDFLSQALALSDIHGEVYPKVNFEKLSATELKGDLLGFPVKEFDKDIKAVTYHGAEIRKTPAGYEATVIYDI